MHYRGEKTPVTHPNGVKKRTHKRKNQTTQTLCNNRQPRRLRFQSSKPNQLEVGLNEARYRRRRGALILKNSATPFLPDVPDDINRAGNTKLLLLRLSPASSLFPPAVDRPRGREDLDSKWVRNLKVCPNLLGEGAMQRKMCRSLDLLIAEAASVVMRPSPFGQPVRSPVSVLQE